MDERTEEIKKLNKNPKSSTKQEVWAKYMILALVLPLVLILDQWTKQLIVEHFRYGESLSVLDSFFSLTYVRNQGAAFGMLSTAAAGFRVPFFFIVPCLALLCIAALYRKISNKDYFLAFGLSLIMAGAVGNFIDRIHYGYVVDFLDFYWMGGYHFPAFNIADSAISIGVGIFILDSLVKEKKLRQSLLAKKLSK